MELIKTDGGPKVAGNEDRTDEYAAIVALEQLFTGLRVGLPTLTVRCCACGTELWAGDTVSVYAYRTVETLRWYLARCRCPDCVPDNIATPTLGATGYRVSTRLAVVSKARGQQYRQDSHDCSR